MITKATTVVSDQEKANLLNNFFASVGVVDDGKPLDVSSTTSRGIKLDSIAFTPEILLRVMRNIKSNSSPGPDNFDNRFCKVCYSST